MKNRTIYGNLSAKTQSGNSWAWGYDYENRQISFDAPGTTTDGSYVYNASGARIQKTVNGVTEGYILDGANIIADYNLVSGNWNLESSYVTPFLDQNLLVSRIVNQASETYYYMADGLGSVRNLVNSVESVANSYDYLAFGESLNWAETVSNRYTYTSREWDVESANYYYRARYYTPTNGRFTARDPIEYEGGLNLYSYVKSNPINWTDPMGLQEHCNNDMSDMFAQFFEEIDEWGPRSESCEDCARRIMLDVNRETTGGTFAPDNGISLAPNSTADAFRHCYASARISRECPFGRFCAFVAGLWQELRRGNTLMEASMDLHNNEQGRSGCGSETSLEGARTCCLAKVYRGDLKIIITVTDPKTGQPKDYLVPSNQDPKTFIPPTEPSSQGGGGGRPSDTNKK